MTTLPKEIIQMPLDEKCELAEALLEHIRAQIAHEQFPITQEQKAEINEQLQLLKEGKLVTYGWDEVKHEMLGLLAKSK